MPWMRCPHCATFLANVNAAEDEWCGCPVCGGVFVAEPGRAVVQVEKVERRPANVPPPDRLDTFFPPGPRDVPDDLTVPGSQYRRRALLLLCTLTLFFGVYLCLLIGSGCMIFWSLRWLRFLGLPFSFVSLLVFFYLLKGFFKTEMEGQSLRVEITETEEPRLFAFLHRLCAEVGAPAPHRVLLSPEVNAAACYEHSLVGLLRPSPKNLILGLGLVNVLTLSEFKAVLAHEFGHFAQSSMKLSAHVYTVNRLLLEVVAGRDWLDAVLLRFRSQSNFVGLIATVCWGVVSGLRYAMTGLFYAINFFDKSLSRQMEFHADLVAVSASGSEAIVRALARFDFALEALEAAAVDLKLAADHDRYSRDLFFHQREAVERLRQQRKDPQLGKPPPLSENPESAPELFDPEDGPPRMWADHPSNYDREQNAKRRYVPCPLDDRPAWLLFDNAAEACERVTWRFYRLALKIRRDADLEEPQTIQAFLDDERRAVTYDPCYHGMYDDRFIEPGELNELVALDSYEIAEPTVLRQRYSALYGRVLAGRAASYCKHLEERKRLLSYRRERGQGNKEPLEFRGRRYRPRDITALLKFLDEQQRDDRRLLAKEDRAVFLTHFQMSRHLGGTAAQSLRQRYSFHLDLQRLLARLLGQQDQLESALASLADEAEGALPARKFNQLLRLFRGVRDTLRDVLEEADQLCLPPLPHLKAGAHLGPFLWDRPLVGSLGPSGQSISVKKIQKLEFQLAQVIDRARHMHFKSLGSILTLQKEIARRFLHQFAEEVGDAAAATEQRE
jgi:Zn-dependent protease with chaperone function